MNGERAPIPPSTRPRRVLHLINHVRFGFGNVHAAVDLACAQARRGDRVWIASQGGDYEALLAQEGVGHLSFQQERRDPVSVFGMLRGLSGLIREQRPDLLHAHMMTGAVVGWAAGRLLRTPLVATVHNGFDRHAVLMGLADRVVAVSQGAADQIVQRGIARRKVAVVLNGTVGAARRDFFPQSPLRLARPSVATICGLHPRKGAPDLIAAFALVAARVPQASLYLIGEGPHQAEYEALADATGFGDRIHFTGQIRDTKSVLKQTDVFVLASHDEPFGLVLTEAREAGCAVVATRVGGIPEALDDGAAGRLIPPHRPDTLADALTELLTRPEAMEEAKASASRALAKWSVQRVAEDYARVYDELLIR